MSEPIFKVDEGFNCMFMVSFPTISWKDLPILCMCHGTLMFANKKEGV